MVINTSEPIPPPEATDAMLAIPEIEEALDGLIDEGMSSPYADTSSVPPFDSASELTPPPAWSPPPAHAEPPAGGAPPAATTATAANVAAEEPSDSIAAPTEETSLAGNEPFAPQEGGKNPFSTQLERQVQGTAAPEEVANPYASMANTEAPSASPQWGDIPPAATAEQLAASLPAASPAAAAATPYSVARQAIDEALRRGELAQGLLMLTQFCGDSQLAAAEAAELETLLGQLAGSVIYSTDHQLEPAYRVQAGETLPTIAARYQVTPELLAKINGLSAERPLAPGTELKVVRGPFQAIFEPQGLRLMLEGRYAGRFAASGPQAWPTDTWIIQQKLGQNVSAGSAPIGSSKQIVLVPAAATDAAQPALIRTGTPTTGETTPTVYVSVRDMDDLYDILTLGSRVTIRR
jgi:LysM repeat protein